MAKDRTEETPVRPGEPTRVWNRKFVALLIIDMVAITGNFMVRPVIAAYAVELGATFAVAGIVSGMSWAIATLLRPATGYFSDRLNKKTSFAIASVAATLSAFGCAASDSVALVGLFVAVGGISMSFQAIALTSLTALCVPHDRIGSGVGWMGIVMNVAMAAGPAAAAAVAEWGGYRMSFAAGGVLCVTGLIMLIFFKPPAGSEGMKGKTADAEEAAAAEQHSGSRIGHILSQAFHGPTVIIALAGVLVVWSGNSLSTLLFTVEDMGYLTHATLYYILYAALGIAARPLAGWLSDKTGSAIPAVPLMILGACGMLALVFGHGIEAIIICGVCMGIGQASATSVVMAESVRGVDAEHLGRATNTYFMGVDLGGALATWVGGLLIQVGTPTALFGFNAFTCLACAALVVFITTVRKRRVQNLGQE